MAPKNNAKAGKGKGKDATEDKGKGGKAAVKGAQSINVRHILVCGSSAFLCLGFGLLIKFSGEGCIGSTNELNAVRETR